MPTGQRLTVEEFFALPETKPHLEYCDGLVTQQADPDLWHSFVAGDLGGELCELARREGGFGGFAVSIHLAAENQIRIYVADVAYWAADRPLGERRAGLPPTLAVEVLALDEPAETQREKCRFYRAAGVPVAWLIEPDARTVEVFEEGGDRPVTLSQADTLTSAFLPGFAYPLKELFSILDRFQES